MYSLTVLIATFSFITWSQCRLCVLEPMVTIATPVCVLKTNCSSTVQIREARNSNAALLPLLSPDSPSFGHYPSVQNSAEPAYEDLAIVRSLVTGEVIQTTCNESEIYRSFDGTCNNLKHPSWGIANSAMLRLLPAAYSGSNGQIRKSVNGSDLPLPRKLSQVLLPDANRPVKKQTLVVMQWGQLVTHDMARSPSSFSEPVDCCAPGYESYKNCYPIIIPANDPFYSKYNQTCISKYRTRIVNKTVNCSSIPYQISAVSQSIDASQLYGSTDAVSSSVRKHEGGLLETHLTKNGREFPELSTDPLIDCSSADPNITCFHSGDSRINQNTQMTCLQTVLLREHNRIAKNLSALNPHWDDDKLFEESRNILIAVYQHITYKEYLPLILGDNYMKKYNLTPLNTGYTTYHPEVNIATINGFTASAFRMFHSQIQGRIDMFNESRCPMSSINISDWMNRPGIIMNGSNFDSFLLGLTIEPSQKVDEYFTTQVTELLFHGKMPYGEDLESYDIQRGRDHGLASYNSWREICNLPRARNFSDLLNDIEEKNVKLLSELYENVDDIDFFVGGVLEKLVPGTSSGPTILCITGEQFVRKKIADRFWYEHGGLNHSFSKEKLQEIRKGSLSRLLCDNGDNINKMQPNSFQSSSLQGNKIIPCSQIPIVNLTKWKE